MVNRHRRRAPGPSSGTSRLLEDAASDQIRRRVQVGVLLPAAHALVGHEPQAPRPVRGAPRREGHHQRMAEFRDQVAGLLQDGREPCTDDEVRVEHEAETKRMWLPKGKRTKLYVDRKKASRSFIGALSLTTKKMRIHPIEGNQNAEQTRPHDGSPGARDRCGEEDRSRPGQRQVPPRQALERSLCPRSGPGAHHTHLHAPPTPPTLGPTEHIRDAAKANIANPRARSPRKTPSRPSPPTSPTAPSTTTSSTSQSHHHAPTLFNSSHT